MLRCRECKMYPQKNIRKITSKCIYIQRNQREKRALWSWQKARASIASRWCWLQAQVQELEYKIRQHTDLHTQVREAKGPVELEGEPVAYEGSLPGSSDAPDGPETETCARVRPLRRETFKKRKLLQMHNLHIATNKAAKPSDIRCSCVYKRESCAVCTGRAEPTEPAPPACTLAPAQRLARVDPGYHPVLSDIKDVSPSLHLSALASRSWFRARAGSRVAAARRPAPRAAPPHAPQPRAKPNPPRLKRGRPPLSRKIRERDREDETSTSSHERCRGRFSTEGRPRRPSYDIDNIVIPQSIAASTRPQILTYKEIITPKWRVLEIPEVAMNNGISKSDPMSMESEEEDISEAAVLLRHVRAERRERGRYARTPRPRRNNDADNSNNNGDTPGNNSNNVDELPALLEQHNNTHPPEPAEPGLSEVETVRPYSPRRFPLASPAYSAMLAAMPAGYRAPSPAAPAPASPPADDDSSTLSPLSGTAFDGDDPDDAEWEPSIEKIERRKSTLR